MNDEGTDMIDTSSNMPNDEVVCTVAERLALKEIENRKFVDKTAMGSFQTGYSQGFIEGVAFLKSFCRRRDVMAKCDESFSNQSVIDSLQSTKTESSVVNFEDGTRGIIRELK